VRHLQDIDNKSIRPLRAIALGEETEGDKEILSELMDKANELRLELAELAEYEKV
jgi:hypothetical protein